MIQQASKAELWARRRPDLVLEYEDELIRDGVVEASRKRVAQARKRARGGKYRKRRER